MKTGKFLFIAFAVSLVSLLGCNGTQQSETQTETNTDTLKTASSNESIDYSGVYKSGQTAKGCNLTITLTKENDVYKYALTGEHYDQEGIAIIEKSDAVYITFDGPIGNNKPKAVHGQIDGNKIMIQNYGNSMNEYHFFVECDEKYLEFSK